MTHPTYHHTPNSNDVRMPLDGTRLLNIQPMGEEFYDKAETGPMFTAEAEGFDGVLHLFEDEIRDLPIEMTDLRVEAVMFGNDRLDALDGWQGDAWAVTRGDDVISLHLNRESAEAQLPSSRTWTFVGHWENDKIVVEYVVPGEAEDPREDTGFWEQGLFAASASGATQDEALATVRAEYETDEDDEPMHSIGNPACAAIHGGECPLPGHDPIATD